MPAIALPTTVKPGHLPTVGRPVNVRFADLPIRRQWVNDFNRSELKHLLEILPGDGDNGLFELALCTWCGIGYPFEGVYRDDNTDSKCKNQARDTMIHEF